MKIGAALLLLALAAPASDLRYFRYSRPLLDPHPHTGQTCVALDGELYAHAAPQLADLRLYHGGTETPYAIHMEIPPPVGTKRIPPLNLGSRGGETVFDAAMPDGAYDDLELDLMAQNFLSTVTVFGSQTQTGSPATKLGSFTIFDLTRQKLGRSTVLHLPHSNFRFLYFHIAGSISPSEVTGLSVGRLPEGEPEYETIAAASNVQQKGHSSIFEFETPAGVPVDRIAFTRGATPANFSRDVSISVEPVSSGPPTDENGPDSQSTLSGTLLRLHRMQDGHRIDEEDLAIGVSQPNSWLPEKWIVAIDNGDDPPLTIESVRLEMLKRDLCFDSAATGAYILFYGDPILGAPRYDYAKLFAPQAGAPVIALGAEEMNLAYRPRPDDRPFTEKHPALLWVALIAVIALLGWLALRSTTRPGGTTAK
ncbi:MAG TPA: hypothetical protein VHX11_05400 [Acidobacteriaceae bacterium]|jgi:hypothetical protein|nr:hypothetical protein [Acidobacteriaceae bacterium]